MSTGVTTQNYEESEPIGRESRPDRHDEGVFAERIARGLRSVSDLLARAGLGSWEAPASRWVPPGPGQTGELERLSAAIGAAGSRRLRGGEWGPDDDFFGAGGSSVEAVELVAELSRELGILFTLDEFFVDARPRRLAERWLERVGGAVPVLAPATASAPAAPAPTEPALDAASDAEEDLRAIQADVNLADALPWVGRPAHQPPRRILLTGATGFLGSHLLFDLLRHSDSHVVALVRGATDRASQDRLAEALQSFGLPWSAELQRRVTVVAGDIQRPFLGWAPQRWQSLSGEIDSVVNVAAAVDFLRGYRSLRQSNVTGPLTLAQFAMTGRPKPLHHISSIAVFNEVGIDSMGEDDPVAHVDRLFAGYDKSKWAAEAALRRAREHGLTVTFLRPGGIGGHTETGAYNPKDLSSAFIAAWLALRSMPEFRYLNVAPVDWVSRIAAQIVLEPTAWGYNYNLVGKPSSQREVYRDMAFGGMNVCIRPLLEWRREFLAHLHKSPAAHLESLAKVLQSPSAFKLVEATLTGPAATGQRTEAFIRRWNLPPPARFDGRAQLAELERLVRDGRAVLPGREAPPYLQFDETMKGEVGPIDGPAASCTFEFRLAVASFHQLVKDRRVDVHGEVHCQALHSQALEVERGDLWVRPDDGVPERHGLAHPLLRYYLVLRAPDGQRWWLSGTKLARPGRDLWRQGRTLRVEGGREGEAATLTGELVVPSDSYVREQVDGIRVNPSIPAAERRLAKLLWLGWFGAQVGLGFLDPLLRATAELLDTRRAWEPKEPQS
jgi:thioester reductase-like protein